jgi:thiol-disulfide isomerase/thioredoxin
MRRRPRLLSGTLLVIVGLVLLAVFGLAPKHAAITGRAAPALPSEHLVGPPVTLASLLASAKGRASLVIFWASWCEPCVHEAPAIQRFAASRTGRGRVVGVDWSDALSGARAFIRQFSWTFSNLRDGEGTVGNNYRMTDLPTTFVLDGKGRIRTVLRGPQDERSLAGALRAVENA